MNLNVISCTDVDDFRFKSGLARSRCSIRSRLRVELLARRKRHAGELKATARS